jgi:NAD-dependent SIR2 family protein deacetylase
LAWAFYGHRLNLYRKTVPHQGFGQLLQMACSKPAGYFVFTSNVDGQFQKAGFPAERIVECHGSIHSFQCTVPCGSQTWLADVEVLTINEASFRAQPPLPKCPACGALARPNILMFGDMGWVLGAREAQDERYHRWLKGLLKQSAKVVVVEIGAGSTIATVRYNSERVARNTLGTLVRINTRESDVPEGHIGLPLGAAEGIQRIARVVSGVDSQ